MAKYTLKQAPKIWKKRERDIPVKSMQAAAKASRAFQRTTKRLAPRKTGETRNSIVRKKIKTGWQVTSFVVGSFKQNLWANRSAGTRQSPNPRMVWNKRRPTFYGDGSHVITGTPGFWGLGAQKTRRMFMRELRKGIRKVFD